jgi:two-component system osmolarity sensor histidine kinase EnvZ
MIVWKRLAPRGLFARSLLIIVLPIALMQIVLTYVFFDLHWEQVSRRMSEAAAGDVAHLTRQYLRDPGPEAFAAIARDARADLRLSVALQPGARLPQSERRAAIPAFDRTLRRALEGSLDQPFWFDTTRYPDYVDIRVQVDGGVLRFLAYRDRVFASTGGIFVLWVVGATMLLATVSVLFIRNQVKPMERLADAAERFGRGESVGLKPAGSAEVRRAAVAFLHMRARINRHIEQRTNLLAGVSHDLRTPLTRLKLHLALMPPSSDSAAAQADIVQMERMLEEYLDFARGQWSEEAEPLDLAAIARAVCEDARRGGATVDDTGLAESLPATGRPATLNRCLANLVENAVAHGTRVAVSSGGDEDAHLLHVDDDGPGIAPEDHEEAMKPFSRLDPSRNLNRKGVGLGLAIARDAARGHGGDLLLSRAPLGGLRVTVRLPR